jgi:hypothetical protein
LAHTIAFENKSRQCAAQTVRVSALKLPAILGKAEICPAVRIISYHFGKLDV